MRTRTLAEAPGAGGHPSLGVGPERYRRGIDTLHQPRRGLTVWLTGLPAAGKTTVAFEVRRRLVAVGRPAHVLDGDELRLGLNADLGFSAADRAQSVRRAGEVARILAEAGIIAIAALVSPYAADRARVRRSHEAAGLPFLESSSTRHSRCARPATPRACTPGPASSPG